MVTAVVDEILAASVVARGKAPSPGDKRYEHYCDALARHLEKDWDLIQQANDEDVRLARERNLPAPLIDRLAVTSAHRDQLIALAADVRERLPEVTAESPPRAAGALRIRRIRKPLGVLLMIYEARPTVTVEGALLGVAVGNVVILRGGAEIAATNTALGRIAADAAASADLPEGMIHVVAEHDRAIVRELLTRHDAIDALIPRGSPTLIDYCRRKATIPVIASGGGVNHLYVDESADVELAARIALDSKLVEPTACNTVEMVLAHEAIAERLVTALIKLGEETTRPFSLHLEQTLLRTVGQNESTEVKELAAHDYGREFLDRTLGLRSVRTLGDAVEHIHTYGAQHTEGVVAREPEPIAEFLRKIDAAALVVNGSLRLHDGPTMRLGPEISISTGRMHVRGPVGLDALLTHSWVVDADGALRG